MNLYIYIIIVLVCIQKFILLYWLATKIPKHIFALTAIFKLMWYDWNELYCTPRNINTQRQTHARAHSCTAQQAYTRHCHRSCTITYNFGSCYGIWFECVRVYVCKRLQTPYRETVCHLNIGLYVFVSIWLLIFAQHTIWMVAMDGVRDIAVYGVWCDRMTIPRFKICIYVTNTRCSVIFTICKYYQKCMVLLLLWLISTSFHNKIVPMN